MICSECQWHFHWFWFIKSKEVIMLCVQYADFYILSKPVSDRVGLGI